MVIPSVHLTRTGVALPSDFGSLMTSLRRILETSDRKNIENISSYFPANLVCLLDALVHMLGVQTLGLSDLRWLSSQTIRCYKYQGFHCDDDSLFFPLHSINNGGQQELFIEPSRWYADSTSGPPEYCREWYRGFFVLTQAAPMLKLTQIRTFTMNGTNDGLTDGISHTIFQMSSAEIAHTQNGFAHLKKIHLIIKPHGQTDRRSHS